MLVLCVVSVAIRKEKRKTRKGFAFYGVIKWGKEWKLELMKA